jgi:ribosomal protein L3
VESILSYSPTAEVTPLNRMECVLENGFREGVVLLDAKLQRHSGVKSMPLFTGSEGCSDGIVLVEHAALAKKIWHVVTVMHVELRRVGRDEYEYDALLHGVDPLDPYEELGTIGVACGAGAEGVIKRRDGHWFVAR